MRKIFTYWYLRIKAKLEMKKNKWKRIRTEIHHYDSSYLDDIISIDRDIIEFSDKLKKRGIKYVQR